MITTTKYAQNAKKIFKKCGTCSQTFAHILNREFEHPLEDEERALDPLAGGLLNTGHQCGMLWGSALAIGAESFRINNDLDKAVAVSISATKQVMESFEETAGTVNCYNVTGYHLDNYWGLFRYMVKTMLKGMENSKCFNLAEEWAPEAVRTAIEGLIKKQPKYNQQPLSCATEVAKRMGATDEESVMIAGFAGGMGLSGNACGALGAAIWMKTLRWCKENPGKTPPYLNNPALKKLLNSFKQETGSKIRCKDITNQTFETLDDHTNHIKKGGCKELIDFLAE